MKYKEVFGIYGIVVEAKNQKEAINRIRNKWASYKDGSQKKEYLRAKINNDLHPFEVFKHNGFWIEKHF